MIFAAAPGPRASSPACPAPISPTTGSVTGDVGDAPATSSRRTAYPSIAELSKLGKAMGATTSSAHARPRASSSGWGTAAIGSRSFRMRSRCSSTELTRGSATWSTGTTRSALRRRLGGEHRPGRDSLRSGRLELDVPHDLDTSAEGPVTLDGQRVRLAHRRRTLGEALVELADQLVEVGVEVDVRDVRGDQV